MANNEQIKKILKSFDPKQVFNNELRQNIKILMDKLISRINFDTGEDFIHNIKNLVSKKKNDMHTKLTLKKNIDELLKVLLKNEIVKNVEIPKKK
jgi:hypothetical protein